MSDAIRLLVRADDAGSSWSSNMGCYRACAEGIARGVEVMMPGAWVPHAAELFNAAPRIDVGIHLTLTSEWDAVKWRPLTHAPSLTDEAGYFLPLLSPRAGDRRPCLARAAWSLDEVACELRAQVALGVAMFKHVSHVSTHMLRHLHEFDARVGEVVADICGEFGLADDAFGHGLPRIEGYPKLPRDGALRAAELARHLAALEPGTYILIDHPAVLSPELLATGHEGYRDVAADRTSCLMALTSETALRAISDHGVELISYRDL
ncbi:MAG: ChbG/HpnK family deacetylase [Pseudomonadota bacterium]